jgi:hypothetical protein
MDSRFTLGGHFKNPLIDSKSQCSKQKGRETMNHIASAQDPRGIRAAFCFRWRAVALFVLLMAVGTGCVSPTQTVGLLGGVTAVLGQAPADEIEETYYLGVFDPQEQVPPTVYRVTVHGQASAMSFTRFASGWVPADVADSLNTNFSFDTKNGGALQQTGTPAQSVLQTGRRLVLFGPEGFREAPRNSRLVIVMGQDPSSYFNAISQGLTEITQVQMETSTSAASQQLFKEFARITSERDGLVQLQLQMQLVAAQNKK